MKKYLLNQSGATAIEYTLIAAAMAAVLVAAMPSITNGVLTSYTNVGARITAAK